MTQMNERVLNAVSTRELERRWAGVRALMREQQVDALVMQNSSDWVGGYVRWFSNRPATNGYPTSVVFPASEGMTLVEQGPAGGALQLTDEQQAATGIARVLTTPSYPSIHYTGAYDANLVIAELRRSGVRRLGLVAPAAWYHSFGARLAQQLVDLALIDFTDAIDRLKAIKSEEERACIRQVAALQDEVMRRVSEFIRPGLRDFEVAAYAQYVAQQLGSEQGIFLNSSAPPGQAASFRPRSMQGRVLQAGDVFSLLVETNGAGGYYTELSRIFVLGRASVALREAHARVLEAQRHALSLLKPGMACKDIFARQNDWMRAQGLGEERRLSIHGMGYDMVERPLIRHDEDMTLAEHMAIVCHPGLMNREMFVHNTDIYLIEAQGPSECLHRTPKQLFELG